MFVSLILVALYLLPFFIVLGQIGDLLIIPTWGAALAALTFVYSFVLYLWAPRKAITPSALTVYLLLVATTAVLLLSTGGTYSSFISLWIVILAFAGVFGLLAALPIMLASAAYIGYLVLYSANLPTGQITIVVAATLGPIIASYIIFHSKSKKTSKDEAAYHQLASELNQVSNTSEAVIRSINDGVIALDSKGNVKLMNPAAQRILGWGSHDALNLNYPSVLKLSDSENQPVTEANDPIANVLATNKEVDTNNLYAKTGGGKRILLSLVVSPAGQLGDGATVVFRDITKEHAEEREQAEFISTASHEMRTPVASIEGYLGLALNPNTATVDAKARDYIEKAHSSAQHLGRLFQDLLDVSKADDGRLSNHPKVVDVIDYIGEIVEGLRPRADEKKLRLFYKPQPEGAEKAATDRNISPVFYANVDNDHLREAVSNLVENAIKYTPKGDVIVDVSGDDLHVTISVEDSGIGIAKEDAAHLFQKFYRIDSSATREIGGTGLGLYLSRRLAEIMGGRIWVESELGKGSTFNLEIPRTDRMEAMRMLEVESSEIIVQPSSAELRDEPDEGSETSAIETAPAETFHVDPPAVSPPPQPQSTPQPVSPLPMPPEITQPTQQPQPQSTQPVSQSATQATNGPTLEQIEQNSSAYTARPNGNIQIPVRGPVSPRDQV
jgi:PAS domain S-box-containing protein